MGCGFDGLMQIHMFGFEVGTPLAGGSTGLRW